MKALKTVLGSIAFIFIYLFFILPYLFILRGTFAESSKIEKRKGVIKLSLSEAIVKIIGIVLAVVGLALILGAVGLSFLAVSFLGPIWSIVVGVVFLGAGIYIIRGGNFTL